MEEDNEIILPRKYSKVSRDKNYSLVAEEDIKAMSVIMEIQLKKTISAEFVKRFLGNGDFPVEDEQLICLYLIKLLAKKDQQLSQRLYSWINSISSGFISFSKEDIRATCDDDLIIQHAAYINHMEQQGMKLYKKSKQGPILSQIISESTAHQFLTKYKWASQFRNTRAFGHTKETIMIPEIDYMNYNPTKNCKKVILLTYQSHNEIPELVSRYKTLNLQKNQNGLQVSDEDEADDEDYGEYLPERKYLGLIAIEDIQREEQILFHYGKFSNRYLLSWYGYCIQNNPYDYLNIYVRKHWEQPIFSFSAIERSTTKIKIKKHVVSKEIYEAWKNLCSTKTGKQLLSNENFAVCSMIEHLKMAKKRLEYKKTENKWITIYCEDRVRIFQDQVELWEKQASLFNMIEGIDKQK